MDIAHHTDTVLDFIHKTRLSDIPAEVKDRARTLLMDIIGVAAVGAQTPTARIITDYVIAQMSAGEGCPSAPILFDGRQVSPAGAALAGGMMIDSLDAHDGQKLTKGHVGCGIVPAILASLAETGRMDDEDELLTCLVIGYEIGTRLGIALHRSADDFHTSGAWIAVACAGLASRIHKLDKDRMFHAMGIAEYHGPRSQMMRVIDHATMLKDGSGWGAMAGVSAAALAKAGFTGAPAITISASEHADLYADLGSRWYTCEQYIKLWPVCRWAQPAIQGVFELQAEARLQPDDIAAIRISTFHEAKRLASPHPTSSDEAQYSICWPVAAAIYACAEGRRFGPYDVSDDALARADIHRLADRIIIEEDEQMNAVFPAQRLARIKISDNEGNQRISAVVSARGDPETPLSYDEIVDKFHFLISLSHKATSAYDIVAACQQLAATENEGMQYGIGRLDAVAGNAKKIMKIQKVTENNPEIRRELSLGALLF